ncbi:hypothetical protein T484DRAFT_1985579, partial [Baffinella frigidus]
GDIDLDLRAIEKAGSDWAAAKEIYKGCTITRSGTSSGGGGTMRMRTSRQRWTGRTWSRSECTRPTPRRGRMRHGSRWLRSLRRTRLCATTRSTRWSWPTRTTWTPPWARRGRSTEAGEVDDEGLGYGPYALAEKRAGGFGTAGKIVGNGGMSKVSWDLMFAAHAGQRLLMKPDNAEEIEGVMQCIRAVSIVPAIQGCLEYAYEASSADVISDADLPKYQAEAYAFCAAALPFLNEADPADAAAVHATVRIDSAGRPDWEIVKNAFGAINLNKMGVRCADVGALSTSQPESKHEECTDGSLSNAMADAGKCDAILMPSSSSVLRAGAGMLVAAVAAMALLV